MELCFLQKSDKDMELNNMILNNEWVKSEVKDAIKTYEKLP